MLYLTLRHYEYITAIARHGSLSEAAANLHVSQPALSAALTRIEDVMGQTLFLRRRGAPLVLTPQGRDLADRASALLEQAARLEKPEATQIETRLTIGIFSDLAPFVMAPMIRDLRTNLPGSDLRFNAEPFGKLIQSLTDGRLDMAVTYDLGLDASFHRTEITRVRPNALIPPDHPLAKASDVSLGELARHNLILSDEGLSIRHMLGLFRGTGAVPRVRHRAPSLELLRSLAALGEGIGLTYSTPKSGHSYDGNPLVAVPIRDAHAVEPIVLVTHGDADNSSQTAEIVPILQRQLNL